jgi:hypothetical protein
VLEKMAGRLIETGALIAMTGVPSLCDRYSTVKPERPGSWMV